MKQPKVIEYYHLVSVARQVLLSIKLDNPQSYSEDKDNCMIMSTCRSGMYLYGGYAPKNLKVLLTYHHMHKIRKSWADRHLHKYFNMFYPSLTKKRMWEIITERRKVFRSDFRKKQQREELRLSVPEIKKVITNPYTKKKITDYMPQVESKEYDRLFPLMSYQYVDFILDKCNHMELGRKSILYSIDRADQTKIYTFKDGNVIPVWATASNDRFYPYGIDFKLFMQPGKMIILEKPNRNRAFDRGYYYPKQEDTMVIGNMDDESRVDEDEE